MPTLHQSEDEAAHDEKAEASQYGGRHTGAWVDRLPPSWIPYVQLARLSPPVAVLLIYIPHLFGVLHAAAAQRQPPLHVIQVCGKLLAGSLFFSNAAHAWNDLIDAPIDRRVARTMNRPIARGDITPTAAIVFTVVQGLLAAALLPLFSPSTARAVIPTIIGTVYYPWAKRHTHFPQVVLGFCLAWGIVVGAAATGMKEPWRDTAVLVLVVVSTSWTVIFDTIYAHQDIEDDIQVGVKSTAVLFGRHTKTFLSVILGIMSVSLVAYGQSAAVGFGFYLTALPGCAASLGTMIAQVDLGDKASCWWWFSQSFWFTAASIIGGLLLEYARQAFYEP